jgi:hypothetical protein
MLVMEGKGVAVGAVVPVAVGGGDGVQVGKGHGVKVGIEVEDGVADGIGVLVVELGRMVAVAGTVGMAVTDAVVVRAGTELAVELARMGAWLGDGLPADTSAAGTGVRVGVPSHPVMAASSSARSRIKPGADTGCPPLACLSLVGQFGLPCWPALTCSSRLVPSLLCSDVMACGLLKVYAMTFTSRTSKTRFSSGL